MVCKSFFQRTKIYPIDSLLFVFVVVIFGIKKLFWLKVAHMHLKYFETVPLHPISKDTNLENDNKTCVIPLKRGGLQIRPRRFNYLAMSILLSLKWFSTINNISKTKEVAF